MENLAKLLRSVGSKLDGHDAAPSRSSKDGKAVEDYFKRIQKIKEEANSKVQGGGGWGAWGWAGRLGEPGAGRGPSQGGLCLFRALPCLSYLDVALACCSTLPLYLLLCCARMQDIAKMMASVLTLRENKWQAPTA